MATLNLNHNEHYLLLKEKRFKEPEVFKQLEVIGFSLAITQYKISCSSMLLV